MLTKLDQNQIKARETRGLAIAEKDRQVKRIGDFNYEVLSQSGNGSYLVSKVEDEWICECPDHRFRDVHACILMDLFLKTNGLIQCAYKVPSVEEGMILDGIVREFPRR